MYLIIWEYHVRAGMERSFEAAYGPDGDWALLFRSTPGYLGTTLLRDVSDPRAYTTLDRWVSRSEFDRFMSECRERYEALDRGFHALTETESRILAVELP